MPQRVLACVLCQSRKVKCDRGKPSCGNCVKGEFQCVYTAARQRRRRFPERELLECLRRYEGLLRQNNIEFEPLHTFATGKASPGADDRKYGSGDSPHPRGPATGPNDSSRGNAAAQSETLYEAKDFWRAMNQAPQNSEDSDDNDDNDDNDDSSPDTLREAVVKKAWDQLHKSDGYLLLGSRKTNVNLSTLHPGQAQIFKLWQIYLENVNPLLKVTHTPTLQARIVDAVSDLTSISPTLEALLFSIYCVSIMSLAEGECCSIFRSTREELLASYQTGCQQALLNCGILRSGDRDCLTAFYLYLVSVRPDTDPRSLSSTLGIAMRIAQRMGIHNESSNVKCTTFEAEMRRRLWWSLAIFDARISEMSDSKAAMLTPTWDCRTPSNWNDFDLQPEMKSPPVVHEKPMEALFAIVRSELGDFIRNSAFYLDFINPAMKSIIKDVQNGPIPEGGELVTLEKMLEDKYFKFCNPENPLHFMTVWTARGQLAKHRLMEHYSMYSKSSRPQTDALCDTAISYCLNMLECDTKLKSSPLTKGYLWLINSQWPFPAYMYIVQDLRRRPVGRYAEKAWEAMSDNYEICFDDMGRDDNPFFRILARMVLQAWTARDAILRQSDEPQVLPRIVSGVKDKLSLMKPDKRDSNIEQPSPATALDNDDFSRLISMPMDLGGPCLLYGIGRQEAMNLGTWGFHEFPQQAAMGVDSNQLDLTAMDWNPMHGRAWRGCDENWPRSASRFGHVSD